MTKIAIIGAGEFQLPLIMRAREEGYETHVFAWEEGAVGKDAADHFYPVSILDRGRILEICRTVRPDAVVSIATELGYITATWLSDRLKLHGNLWKDIPMQTNKFKMRTALQKAGLYMPKFLTCDGTYPVDIAKLHFPLIVKPTDRSGSRAITKITSGEELKEALRAALDASFEHCAIVEEFFEGEEYSCECISFDKRHKILAVTKKYTTGEPHFIETGHMQPADISDNILSDLEKMVYTALDALHIVCGASHVEFRIGQGGQICIMEIGARMGGDCIGSHLVPLSTGYDYLKMVLDASLGKKPALDIAPHFRFAAVHFIFSLMDFARLEKLEKKYPENVIDIVRHDSIGSHTVSDSSNRFGYTIFAGDDFELKKEVNSFENTF